MVGQWLCGVGGGPPGLQAQQDRRDLQGGEDPDQVQRGQRSRLPNVDHDGGTWRELIILYYILIIHGRITFNS